ncbi:MAG TPA: glycosyltransferase family 2 protein [Kofleriaceae bacterium]|nr:glycosyltransferase family 2 protein [Kofleriaceae bacterium]
MLPSLSIVVPAFNEAHTIATTIEDALEVAAEVAPTFEVLICDDGSRDDTRAIVEGFVTRDPHVRLLARPRNRGIEASMRALYARAQFEWIFLNSADRQWPMSVLTDMAAACGEFDFVIGVRRNKREIYSPYRRVLSWSYEHVVRALGAPGGDPGSIKLARRQFLHRPVVAQGVFAEGERVIRAARDGARIAEVPVEFRPRTAGRARGARGEVVLRAVFDAGRVVSSLTTGWPAPELPVPDV